MMVLVILFSLIARQGARALLNYFILMGTDPSKLH
jgi:hypothetical protein